MKRKLAVIALSATATLVSLTIIDVAHPYEAAATTQQQEKEGGGQPVQTVYYESDSGTMHRIEIDIPVPGVDVPDSAAPPVGSDLVVEVTPPKSQSGKGGPDIIRVAFQEREAAREAAEAEREAVRAAEAAASRAAVEREILEDAWTHPLPSANVSSPYGWRGPITSLSMGPSMHSGTDLAAPRGTPIRAAANGTVTYVGYGHPTKHLTGWVVVIDHGDGLETSYNHMDDGGVLVDLGQQVTVGQDIALVGSSGNSSGPHVHLSVWQDDGHTDPEAFFAAKGTPLR